jgi:uncharacterized protein YjbJ (UPF0337 family)
MLCSGSRVFAAPFLGLFGGLRWSAKSKRLPGFSAVRWPSFIAGLPGNHVMVAIASKGRGKKHVGRKSSTQDKGEGALDKAKGKAKEATGALTGYKAKKSEGRSDQTKGTAKDKLDKAKDLLK